MSNFVVEKRAGIDVLVFANGTCHAAKGIEVRRKEGKA